MSKNKNWIYKITNPKNRIYIGKTNNFKKRMICYAMKKNPARGQNALERSIRKYGWKAHKVEIIWCGYCTDKQSYRLEKFFIKKYNSFKNGLNCNIGGLGFQSGKNHPYYGIKGKIHFNYGRKHTQEEVKRMRGRIVKKSSIEKTKAGIYKLNKIISDMGCNNHNFGITKFRKYKILNELKLSNWDDYIKYLSMGAA